MRVGPLGGLASTNLAQFEGAIPIPSDRSAHTDNSGLRLQSRATSIFHSRSSRVSPWKCDWTCWRAGAFQRCTRTQHSCNAAGSRFRRSPFKMPLARLRALRCPGGHL